MVQMMVSIISGWKARCEAHHGIHDMDSKVNKECSLVKIAPNSQFDSDKMMLVWRIISPFAFLTLPEREKQISSSGFGVCCVIVWQEF